MSEGEILVLIGSIVLGGLSWGALATAMMRRSPLYGSMGLRVGLLGVSAACMLGLLALLTAFAASDVRTAPEYLAMYTALGIAWVGVMRGVLGALLGVRARDDVAERSNPAAFLVQCGIVVGLTLSFAGGNFGDGPGWWVVMPSAGLATLALVGVWHLVETVGHLSYVVTVERDAATGLRAGAMLAACGAIFGRAVAGDWTDHAGLLIDFVSQAWPAVIIAGAECVAIRVLRPSAEMPRPSVALAGVPLALASLGIAAATIVLLGWW